jgi:hypothetical protein
MPGRAALFHARRDSPPKLHALFEQLMLGLFMKSQRMRQSGSLFNGRQEDLKSTEVRRCVYDDEKA